MTQTQQMESINNEMINTTARRRITLSNAFDQKASVVISKRGWVSVDLRVERRAEDAAREDADGLEEVSALDDSGGCSK